MSIKYLSVHFFLLFITLMAIRTTLGEQSWEDHTKALSSGFSILDDGDDGGGEICEPNKSNACESPTAQCIWRPLDMLYKCTEPRNYSKKRLAKRKRFKSDEKKNGTRKRMVKGFDRPGHRQSDGISSYNLVKINPFHKGGQLFRNQEPNLDTSFPDIIIGAEAVSNETNTERSSDSDATTEVSQQQQEKAEQSQPYSANPQPSTESNNNQDQGFATQSSAIALFHDPWKSKGKIVPGAIDPKVGELKVKPEGTWEVPKYSGDLGWDGHTIFSDTCILKSVMAEALEEKKTLESKQKWVEDNHDQVCNFRKFFHCTIEQADSELVLDDGEEEELPTEPVCRCYESAMPVVRGTCYIPADLGAKSACGDHVTAPYPVKSWKRAPILKPRCTPNSDCKESQYWFGKRCTCRYNARWNPQTHTCDKGTKLTLSLGLLFVSYAIICLKP